MSNNCVLNREYFCHNASLSTYSINSILLDNTRVSDISGSYGQPIHDIKGDEPLFNLYHRAISTSYYYKKKSLENRKLNPNAESFVSSLPDVTNDVHIPNSSKLNIVCDLTSYSLNPCADIFIPLHTFPTHGLCAMIALIATVLILSAFILTNIFNIDNKQDVQELSPRDLLTNIKLANANKIVIGHLNINSIRNKFDSFKYLIDDNMDIILLSETKLNDTFHVSQFLIHGFHAPYRADSTANGGGLFLFVREHLPTREIKVEFSTKIEAIVIEINLKKRK